MKYVATKKFNELGSENNHQGLERDDYHALKDGNAVECTPPKRLIEGKYLEAVKAKKGK